MTTPPPSPAAPGPAPIPPGVWQPAHAAVRALLRPVEHFLHIQATAGVLLVVVSVAALAWANSPWRGAYASLWHLELGLTLGSWSIHQPLHFLINEGLMVVFFFVVGLEVRREIFEGELADLRRAALPIAAAVGGMLVPAALYLAFNPGPLTRGGWGVPTATDIAFAVGILALLGKRVPAAVRVLLLALAIIDDLGAILVIAVFYSDGLAWHGLALAAAAVLLVKLLQALGVRRPSAYVVPGALMWWGFLQAGVHPTLAGVVLGLLTPVRAWYGAEGFLAVARQAMEAVGRQVEKVGPAAHALLEPLEVLGVARREAVAPLHRFEARLHPWVAFGVLPLFAFANAGVDLSSVDLSLPGAPTLLVGIVVGLAVGKPLGITLGALAATKLGLASLPRGVGLRQLVVVGLLGGIGFTMAIFIAGLAFSDPELLAVAKLAVLGASLAAGLGGLLAGFILLPRVLAPDVAAVSPDQAEKSSVN